MGYESDTFALIKHSSKARAQMRQWRKWEEMIGLPLLDEASVN